MASDCSQRFSFCYLLVREEAFRVDYRMSYTNCHVTSAIKTEHATVRDQSAPTEQVRFGNN